MDANNWKLVLMQWINCTKLSEKTLFSLDEADVEQIFSLFKSHVTSVDLSNINLIDFLKVNYPEFDLHFDDSSQISTTDSMYIFSLLLHYSCVKQPQEYYHNLCNGLTAKYQNYVARFLTNLVDKTEINREILRSSISVSLPQSPQIWTAESPIRTPRAKYSPPTPKTNLLEEKTRDLQLIKAQLETERYEKGFLEVVVKKNEQQIQNMSTEHKKLLNEIKKLRNELLESNTENCTPNKNINDEKIKKKLRKEIADKEEMIIKIKLDIDSLNEDKKICNEKLLYAEKQVALYLDKCKENDIIIDDLKLLLQNKEEKIKFLHEANAELEMIIKDMRTENHSHDQSVECLDFSFSQTTNSSGQSIEPENLGYSVIDLQLKEQEKENVKLKENINFLTKENINFKEQLELMEKDFITFKESTNKQYDILNETINALNNDNLKLNIESKKINDNLVTLQNEDKLLKDEKNKLIYNLEENERQIKKLNLNLITMENMKDDMKKQLEESIIDLKSKNMALSTEINQIKTMLEESNIANAKLSAELDLLTQTNSENLNKISNITKQINEVQESNTTLAKENKLLSENSEKLIDSNNNLLTEKDKLAQDNELAILQNKDLVLQNEKNINLIETKEKENIELTKKVTNYENEIISMKTILKDLSVEKSNLDENLSKLNEKLLTYDIELKSYEATNDDLQQKLIAMENNKDDMKKHLEESIIDLESKNMALSTEINQIKTMLEESNIANAKLSAELDLLTQTNSENINKISNITRQINEIQESNTTLAKENKLLSENSEKLIDSNSNLLTEKEKLAQDNELAILQNKDLVLQNEKNINLIETKEKENIELTKKVTNYENEIISMKTILKDLSVEKSNLDENLSKLNEKLLTYDIELKSYETTNDDLQQKLITMENNKDDMKKQLEESIIDLESKNMALSTEINQIKTMLEECNIANAKLSAELDLLTQTNSENLNKISNITKQINEVQESNTTLAKENKLLSENSEKLIDSNSNLLTEKEKLAQDNELAILQNKDLVLQNEKNINLIETKEKENIELTKKVTNYENEIISMKTILKDLSVEKSNLDENLSKLNEKLLTYDNELKSYETTNDDLQQKLITMENNKDDMKKQLEERIIDLESKNMTLSTEINQIKTMLEESNIANAKLTAELDLLTQTNSENINKISNITKQINEIQESNATLAKENKLLSENSEKLIDSNNNLLTEKHKLVQDNELAILQNKDLLIQNEKLIKENEKLIKDNENLFIYNKKQTEYSEKLQSKNEQLVGDNTELNNNVSTITEDYQKLVDDIKKLERSNSEYNEIIKKYTEEKVILFEEKVKLQDIIADLTKNNERLNACNGKLEGSVIQLSHDIEILNENIKTLSNTENNLNEVNGKLIETNKALTKHNKELVEQKEILSKQNLCFATENEELRNCNSKEIDDKTCLIKDNEKLMKENENLLKQRENLIKEKEVLSEENIKLITDHEALIKANSTLVDNETKKLADLNEKLLKTTEQLELRNNNISQENEELCLKNTELTRTKEELFKENNLLKEELVTINKIMQSNEQLQKESDLGRQKIETELHDLLNENKLAKERENSLITENTKLSGTMAMLESTNAELLKNKNELENLIETLKTQHSFVNKESEQKLDELNKAKQKNSELEEKLVALDLEYKLNKNCLNTQKMASLELTKEREINEKLTQDVQILRAKLFKHRELSDEKEKSWQTEKENLLKNLNEQKLLTEDKIKENRIELEGKLEKMKTKMKSLYLDEVAKTKTKHEKEILDSRQELQQHTKKLEEYDNYIKKLLQQIYSLNDKQLEIQKQNDFMKTKLKVFESQTNINSNSGHGLMKRPMLPNQMGSNLKMEDEEGELFNNTYLADLKSGGRISPQYQDSLRLSELQFRNSLCLPHLRSSYSVIYNDTNYREDEIKDGGNNLYLDDSLSSLLPSGQRKKVSGATTYKRPGPPTPSKKAGRLSFGSEILKESNENILIGAEACSNYKKSTPGKLKALFNSSSKVKDEKPYYGNDEDEKNGSNVEYKRKIYRLNRPYSWTPRSKSNKIGKKNKLINKSMSSEDSYNNNSSNGENNKKLSYSCRKMHHNSASKSYIKKNKLRRLNQFNKFRKLSANNDNSSSDDSFNKNSKNNNKDNDKNFETGIVLTTLTTSTPSSIANNLALHQFEFSSDKLLLPTNSELSGNQLTPILVHKNYEHNLGTTNIVNSNNFIINRRIPLLSALHLPLDKDNKIVFSQKTNAKLQDNIKWFCEHYKIIIANIIIVLIIFLIKYIFT